MKNRTLKYEYDAFCRICETLSSKHVVFKKYTFEEFKELKPKSLSYQEIEYVLNFSPIYSRWFEYFRDKGLLPEREEEIVENG